MNTSRILIFTGGSLGDWAIKQIRTGDCLVGADAGAWFLIQNGYRPRISLGDFDSVTEQQLEQIRLNSDELMTCDPVMKDQTDTEMAIDWALERKPAEIVLFGALGTRFDHSLANVHTLRKALMHGVPCKIANEFNELRLTQDLLEIEAGPYEQVSLLPLTLEVTGITLTGFKYSLERASLTIGDSLGISNVLIEPVGRITIETGLLLVIQSSG